MINRHFCQNKKIRIFFLFLFFVITKKLNLIHAASCGINPKTIFLPISQSQNLYTQSHTPLSCSEFFESKLSLTYRFQQTSNGSDLTKMLFQYNPINFVGSVDGSDINRPSNALVPEYFGLSPETNASFFLNPQIRNQIIDMQFYFQIDRYWFQTNIPLVKAQWNSSSSIIPNDKMVGRSPLQSAANTYVYNIGQTINKLPFNTTTNTAVLPPVSCDTVPAVQYYNILPIPNDVSTTNPVLTNADYTGAYMISAIDLSEEDGPYSSLQVADQNTGAINFSETIYNEGFSGNDELNQNNWKLGIGTWQTPVYMTQEYTAPCQSGDTITQSALSTPTQITLSSTIQNVNENEAGESQNTLQIAQGEESAASSFTQAMSGEFTFNNTVQRLYGNLNIGTDQNTQTWGVADILLWLGFDAICDETKHLGVYLKMVIPTGTVISENWLSYAFNPVIGNGHHFEFGAGVSAHYDYCHQKNTTWRAKIDGYVTHVFNTVQKRWFDKTALPMSRYALVKELQYSGNAAINALNDNYTVNQMTYLGNINSAEMNISNDVRAEAIAEISLHCTCFSAALGYAFSGLSADRINSYCNNPFTNTVPIDDPNALSYGFKGIAPLSTLVITNITENNEVFTPSSAEVGNGITPTNYPLAAIYQPSQGEALTTDIYVKSAADVTIGGNSGAYLYGNTTNQQQGSEETDPETTYTGPTAIDLFQLPSITPDNTSGIMDAQILNRIFGKVEYEWESIYLPRLGIVGSYGFGSKKYITAAYWDLGIYIGCSF